MANFDPAVVIEEQITRMETGGKLCQYICNALLIISIRLC